MDLQAETAAAAPLAPQASAAKTQIVFLAITRYDPLNTGRLQILAAKKTCCPWAIPGGEVNAGERIALSARSDVEGCIANLNAEEAQRLGEILDQLFKNEGAAGDLIQTEKMLAVHFHSDAELGALVRPTCDSEGNAMQWLPIESESDDLVLHCDYQELAAEVLERQKQSVKTKDCFGTAAHLGEWLVQNGVPAEKLNTWGGSKGTKSIEKLWGELQGEETMLFLANGVAFRVVHVAKGKLFHAEQELASSAASSFSSVGGVANQEAKYLIEAKQTLPNGTEVVRRLFLSEKMQKNETFEQVLLIEMSLRLYSSARQLQSLPLPPSPSLPLSFSSSLSLPPSSCLQSESSNATDAVGLFLACRRASFEELWRSLAPCQLLRRVWR
jgi:ADP-ribose pyrophosphatase YjhB (NUDIX family)